MEAPRKPHLEVSHRILRYIKATHGQGIYFSSTSILHLKSFQILIGQFCLDTRRSVIGLCVFLGDPLLSWKSKKQNTISRSFVESKYRAMAVVCCELIWLKSLLNDLLVDHSQPAMLFSDNKAALHIAANPVFMKEQKASSLIGILSLTKF